MFPPPRLDPAALYGIVGEAVALLRPCTEAEDANVLVSLLIGLGAMIGPEPYVAVGTDKHTAKTMAVIVGDTAKARKGHGWSASRLLLQHVDEMFFATRYVTGLSTGEGLINRLRDSESATPDIGAGWLGPDPRLLIVEEEWGKLLDQDKRRGNTLTAVLRLAWGHGPLEVLTRRDPLRASHHIGLVGHITYEELAAKLPTTLAANGFANRHLFVSVQRDRILPLLAEPDEVRLSVLASGLREAVQPARTRGQMRLDSSADDLWCDLYRLMEIGDALPGIAGHLLARGPAQTLRLALLYALLDGADDISESHLTAGYAVWRYSEGSVRDLLGHSLAQRLLNAVRAAGSDGLTGRGVHDALGRNVKAEQIDAATNLLARFNLVERVSEGSTPRGGRPAIRLRAVTSTRANESKLWTGAG